MTPTVYTIRLNNTFQLYSFHHSRKNCEKTKVVYFESKSEAKRFSSFLAQTSIQNPLLYQYTEQEKIVENSVYKILEINEEFLKRVTGVSNMGYHKCMIVNEIVSCIDTGFQDMNECIRLDYLEKVLRLEVG